MRFYVIEFFGLIFYLFHRPGFVRSKGVHSRMYALAFLTLLSVANPYEAGETRPISG